MNYFLENWNFKKHNFKNLTYLNIFLIWDRLKGGAECNE